LVALRRYTLIAVLLLIGAALLGWQGGAWAQRSDRPWSPAPDVPAVIAQTPAGTTEKPVAPTPSSTPLPPPRDLPVIATTQGPPTPSAQPARPVLRVAPAQEVQLANAGGRPAQPSPMLALDMTRTSAPPSAPRLGSELPKRQEPIRLAAFTQHVPGPIGPLTPVPTNVPSGPQTTSLTVEVKGPATVSPNQPIGYEIVVRNNGTAPARNVLVEDRVPISVRYLGSNPEADVQGERLVWNLGTVDPKVERKIKVQIQASGEGELESCATATCSTSSCWRAKLTQARLSLIKKGPTTAQVGETVKFELTVTNTGSGAAKNVLLQDKMPPGLQHPAGDHIEADLGTLGPRETKTVTLEAKATQPGRLVNVASVSAPGVSEVSAQAVVMVTETSLALRKTGPERGNPNQVLDYSLVASNTGASPAAGILLTDNLPEGLEFISAADGGTFDPKTRGVEWRLGTLQPGESKAVGVRLRAAKAGDWVNRAVVKAETGREVSAELRVKVEGVPALMLEVVDLDDPVELGAETTYEIRIVNQGTAPCTNIRVVGVAPEGLAVVGAQGPTTHRIEGKQVIFEPLPKLAAKADALFRVRARGVKPGDWRFRTWLSSDHMPRPVYEDESTQVYDDGPGTSTQQEINKRE